MGYFCGSCGLWTVQSGLGICIVPYHCIFICGFSVFGIYRCASVRCVLGFISLGCEDFKAIGIFTIIRKIKIKQVVYRLSVFGIVGYIVFHLVIVIFVIGIYHISTGTIVISTIIKRIIFFFFLFYYSCGRFPTT